MKKQFDVKGYLADVKIGDLLWFMYDNNDPEQSEVVKIEYETIQGEMRVGYITVKYFCGEKTEENRDDLEMYARYFFRTREELIQYYIEETQASIEEDKERLADDEKRLKYFVALSKEQNA